MGVRFMGNGSGSSSISFTSVDLRAPDPSSSSPNIIDLTEILTSTGGVRSSYKPAQRQLEFTFRWSMLNTAEYEALKEFLEVIDGSNNWFTLQDHFIPVKANINCQTVSQADAVYNSTDLVSALWPEKPVGKYVIATSGANNNLRRRIVEYIGGGPGVRVSPAFPNSFNIVTPDTFIIGTPVIIQPGVIPVAARINNLWDVIMTFLEKGN